MLVNRPVTRWITAGSWFVAYLSVSFGIHACWQTASRYIVRVLPANTQFLEKLIGDLALRSEVCILHVILKRMAHTSSK